MKMFVPVCFSYVHVTVKSHLQNIVNDVCNVVGLSFNSICISYKYSYVSCHSFQTRKKKKKAKKSESFSVVSPIDMDDVIN